MESAFAVLAAARPRTAGSPVLVEFAVTGGVVVVVAVAFVAFYVKDLRAREGVSFFKRRRVLRSGVAADATVLSSSPLERSTGDFETAYYSNVYEVPAPDGSTFRARGIEEMPTAFGMAGFGGGAFDLKAGETVAVRYDPADHTTVMVNPYQKMNNAQRVREAQERVREEDRRAEQIAQKEREARLLRGDPPS